MIDAAEVRELPTLPEEVWYKVFNYLTLDDRKSVRLLCHRFYEACNRIHFQKNEEIIFYGNINTNAAIQSFSTSKRKVWNIKLYQVHLEDTRILEFFQKQGGNINSLAFNFCELAPRIFKNIIECCSNLQEVLLIFDSATVREYCRHLFDDFRVLKNSGIICDSVENFTLKVPEATSRLDNLYLTNGDFLCIFDVFPNINSLHLTVEINRDFESSDVELVPPALNLNSTLSFPCVYNQLLDMRQQLEKLHLHFTYSCDSTLGQFLSIRALDRIASIEMVRLVVLSLNSIAYPAYPFLNLKNLTHFDCTRSVSFLNDNSDLVQRLLIGATELRTLTLRTSYFTMNRQCFETLVNSRLTDFNIYPQFRRQHTRYDCVDVVGGSITFSGRSADFSVMEELRNHTLKRLNVSTHDHKMILLFCTCFQNLENLILENVRKNILLQVLEIQTKFRCLLLHNCDSYPREEFSRVDSFVLDRWWRRSPLLDCNFSNLTHLHIVEHRSLSLSKFMFSTRTFSFHQLKSLRIEIPNNRGSGDDIDPQVTPNLTQVWMFIQEKLTQLESLDIRSGGTTTFQQWLALFSALPKLRYFVISAHSSTLFFDAQHEYCFQSHPSLRSICILRPLSTYWGEHFNGHAYYFRDVISKSIVKRDISSTHFSAEDHQYIPAFYI